MLFLKNILKKLIGSKTRKDIRSFLKYLKTYHPATKIIVDLDDVVENYTVIGKVGSHVFCGYFDIDPQSPENQNQFLVHMVSASASVGTDKAELGIADIQDKSIRIIAETKAWCWQMGARLRWSRKEHLLFNSFDAQGYCCIEYDHVKGHIVRRICDALYDVSPDEQFGLSVNFERLQALRPGYGYSCSADAGVLAVELASAPADDGLFYIDLETNQRKLLVSLKMLSNMYPSATAGKHYINHVSIAPDGRNAIFFHIWTCRERPGWKANLCVVNINTGEVCYLEKDDQVSHYDWKNPEEVLITAVDKSSNVCTYRLYNIITGKKKTIGSESLRQDGHPVYSKAFEGFYSDTYPDAHAHQHFFRYSEEYGYQQVASLYSDPRLYGEKRCDLHPHYFSKSETLALDSTFEKKRRQVVVLKMRK